MLLREKKKNLRKEVTSEYEREDMCRGTSECVCTWWMCLMLKPSHIKNVKCDIS